ncbi:MAG: ATP-binding protein [Methylococcales bacterium]
MLIPISLIAIAFTLLAVAVVMLVKTMSRVSTEIKQRQLAEEALRQSETKFLSFYNTSSNAMMFLDEQVFLDCNPATLSMFGCVNKAEFCSKHPAELSPLKQACGTDSITLADQYIEQTLATGCHRFEWLHKRVDTDEVFPTEILLNAVDMNSKRIIQGVIRDLSEQKQSEDRLNLSQEYGGIGLWEADLINNRQVWSKTTYQLVGFPDIAQPTWEDFLARVHPDDRQIIIGETQAHLTQGTKYDVEYRIVSTNGQHRWMRSVGRAEFAADGTPTRFIGIAQDITERKLMEAELKRSNADLEQFAYAISHDMRQPLRMVTSYLTLIETALSEQLNEEQQQFLNFAIDGAKRMDAMILSLLDYSRVGHKTIAFTHVASRTALDEALAFLEPERLASGGSIAVYGEWAEVMINPDELTRLLQNLIGNALKYHEENSPPCVEVYALTTAKMFRVSVRDHGIGIDNKQPNRLFKVFSRLNARSRFEGTGVGLALCRKIVECYGGSIGVESIGEGQGSVFWFELPISQPAGTELGS